MKKVLFITLAAAMLLTLLPATALAATYDATVYTEAELTGAITAANAADGGTIKLGGNITVNSRMEISKAIMIDMNGFSIFSYPAPKFNAFKVVAGGDLTLDNTSNTQSKLLVGTGLADEYKYYGIQIVAGTSPCSPAKATVKANVSIETGCPVAIFGNGDAGSAQLDVYGKLVVSDCWPEGDAYAAISGNGTAGNGGTIINIYNGAEVINTYDAAMYIPQSGVVNVTGGTIVGKASAIAIKSGTLNISGGSLRATGPANIPTAGWSNGINGSGCAIQIESNDGYVGNIVVKITGGTIISANGYALYEYLDSGNSVTEVDSISISGGNFHSAVTVDRDILTSSQLAAANRISITGGIFSKGGSTEVKAGVDPTYTIVIPATVDFGTLQQSAGIKEQPFTVSASGVVIEYGAQIDVSVTNFSAMTDGQGHELPYELYNQAGTNVPSGLYASFDGSVDKNVGKVTVDTSKINYAGDYSGTMVFTITYQP